LSTAVKERSKVIAPTLHVNWLRVAAYGISIGIGVTFWWTVISYAWELI